MKYNVSVLVCLCLCFLAPDSRSDGHEGAEGAAALQHRLAAVRDQLAAADAEPEQGGGEGGGW